MEARTVSPISLVIASQAITTGLESEEMYRSALYLGALGVMSGRGAKRGHEKRTAFSRHPDNSPARRLAAATALIISGVNPSAAINISSAAAVVPAGDVTFWRSTAAAVSGSR
jgi:hypothetical protein